jgi:hypothetical protein
MEKISFIQAALKKIEQTVLSQIFILGEGHVREGNSFSGTQWVTVGNPPAGQGLPIHRQSPSFLPAPLHPHLPTSAFSSHINTLLFCKSINVS